MAVPSSVLRHGYWHISNGKVVLWDPQAKDDPERGSMQ
jgi:hypothetical protein